MGSKLEEFKKIMRQMFQFDQADLDFGIYRIMNQKRDEVEKFLDQDLLPNVKKAFGNYQAQDKARLQEELDQIRKQLEELGVDPETSAKYTEKKAQLEQAPDLVTLENEVYSHLTNFFRRYYDGGDFLSLRRYKQGVYAIPYEGEEVKLHWANADQYYIKTSEYLRDYRFTLPSGRRVHFKLVEANTEQNNNKAPNGKERRFVLDQEQPVVEENGELYIRFNFILQEKKVKQSDLNSKALAVVFSNPIVSARWQDLTTPMPTEKNKKRTLLEKHLNDYTAKNTFDYFIHKDLGGFLRRELDFYIKNEIMFLDDLGTPKEMKLEQYIAKIRAIKEVGQKIIKFLEQLENFQKKLWLKKKFVVETNYCITIDLVPEEFYPEIVSNLDQTAEWVKLFAINEIVAESGKAGYSDPLTVDFLKSNPYLVVDTVFFGQEFKERLIASIENLEEHIDGLLVHSENFQALSLLQSRFKEKIQCIYIDPPYNTMNNEFLYKDSYKHSTWLSMMNSRILLARELLEKTGNMFTQIDYNEAYRLQLLLEKIFSPQCYVNDIIWRRKQATSFSKKQLGIVNDTIFWFSKTQEYIFNPIYTKDDDNTRKYIEERFVFTEEGTGRKYMKSPLVNSLPRPNLRYIFKGINPPPNGWLYSKEKMEEFYKNNELIIPDDPNARIYRKIYEDTYKGQLIQNLWIDIPIVNPMAKERISGFATQKPIDLVSRILQIGSSSNGYILDFFAGSGTTGHTVINMNAVNGGKRKFILIEMGEHFQQVLRPRILQAIYTLKDYKTNNNAAKIIKYIRLESYEDTMNNLELKRPVEQDNLFANFQELREEYILSYMLDMDTSGSASLLNLDYFQNPFNYKLKITRNQETTEEVIDLVETFNYLIGLRVQHIEAKENFTATPDESAAKPDSVKLRINKEGNGEYTFKVVEGLNPAGEKVLVIWRTLTGDLARDNAALNAYFAIKGYNPRDTEFDRIYVNGDNNLANLAVDDGTPWKVMLLEEEFKRLMFDVQDV